MAADLRLLVALALACAAWTASAQTGTRITEPASAPPSRWQADRDALDAALRARALTATDPAGLWIAGQLDAGDPFSQADALAQARIQAPSEKLYLASLAVACLAPMQPLPAPCDATDRLADWATRDLDNGVPSLLLAERARGRNNATAMVAYLEDAAQHPRFDDYSSRGALLFWEAVRAIPGNADPAARAELAASYAVLRESYVTQQLANFCRNPLRLADAIRDACNKAGTAVAQHATTWALRIAGARLAERSAVPGPAQAAASQRLADLQRRAFQCAEAGNPLAEAFESPDATVRARAVTQWAARASTDAQIGEVAACAKG